MKYYAMIDRSTKMLTMALLTFLLPVMSNGFTLPGFSAYADPDEGRNASELISSKGYPVKEYNVTTSDGYIITIQRIPGGRTEKAELNSSRKTPVFIQHGVFANSGVYVSNFPNQSLGFLLADAGYDVWLGNFRGNEYTSHIYLTREDEEFWNFSGDQYALYDLPAMLDAVLNLTAKEKLFYVGWSQGAGSLFALLSEKPEYNKKIALFSALAPAVFVTHVKYPTRAVVPFDDVIKAAVDFMGHGEAFPGGKLMRKLLTLFCGNVLGDDICTMGLALTMGIDYLQWNKTRIPVYLGSLGDYTSIHNLYHITQAVECSCFSKFNYGETKNKEIYGQEKPPRYNLSAAILPVAVYRSKSDRSVAEEDVARLVRELPNVVRDYQVPDRKLQKKNWNRRKLPNQLGNA